ncbi:hypothetical protein [Synechococcus sp. BIOS-E4-1]|uniref:hypothetical protein n=1 Tax=Synechococcus sp. BIOS-E4-1 TaxID=1400864 RepID=UPI00164745FE|nr:hypothetical protein [Synechococcus sp. BIOS-E4-1]
MNQLYQHNQIQNYLDRRLVDFFCEVNADNAWVDAKTLACWVFETNNPSEFQRQYTAKKLRNITGIAHTSAARLSFLDRRQQVVNNRYVHTYKLSKMCEEAGSGMRKGKKKSVCIID